MDFSDDDLIALTRRTLADEGAWEVRPMTGGASDRRYWRVSKADRSVVLSHYTHKRPDNLKFVTATRLLTRIHAACPGILAHDQDLCLLWMEDLGSRDLWSCRQEPWDTRQELYRSALRQAAVLHRTGHDSVTEEENALLEPSFTKELYEWEQNYFLEHIVRPMLDEEPTQELKECWAMMAETLADLPRVLIHRDFQSQNVILHNDRCYLIDYQGLRWGRPEYDVASLLYDPYVSLTADERRILREFHASLLEPEEAERTLVHAPLAAAQRLMQALGAYGNLGANLDRPQYFSFIPIALANLKEAIADIDSCAPLFQLADRLEKVPPLQV